jgi:hypothetical protein
MCAMHGIASGKPSNLAPFMRALHDDKGLAMSFWSLMAKLHDLEQGSSESMLEAVAEGVTGCSVVEVHAAGGEPRRLIKQMAAMLAGEDVDLSEVVRASAPPTSLLAKVETPALVVAPPVVAEVAVPVEVQLQAPPVRMVEEPLRPMMEPEVQAVKPSVGQRASFGVDAPTEIVRTNRVPLEGYGERSANGSARLIAFATLLAVMAGGAVFFARGEGAVLQKRVGPSVRASYDAAWRGVKGMGGWISAEVFGR